MINNVLLCVDNGVTGATIAAYQLLINCPEVSKKDKIYVVNVVTSFDILNEEKNAGNLALAEWGSCFRQLGYNVVTQQIEAVNTNAALVSFAQEIGASHIFIGNTSFSSVSEDSNLVLSVFSTAKRIFQGTTADYLVYYLGDKSKVHVATEKIEILDQSSSRDMSENHLSKGVEGEEI